MNVALSTKLRLAGFCTGIGMLETALETALGVRGVPSESSYHCEWESCTASVLRRVKEASGCEVPIHSNMFTFDGRPLRGKIDGVVAGLPCPAFSVAGKKEGNGDARAWGENFNPDDISTWGPQPHFIRLVDEIRPGFFGIENVSPYLTKGFYAPVGEILHELGYEYQTAVIATARSVGASHKRERCFILGIHRDYDIRDRLGECGFADPVFGLAEDGHGFRWRGRGNGNSGRESIQAETQGLRGELAVGQADGKRTGLQGSTECGCTDQEGRQTPSGSVGQAGGTLAPEEGVGQADGLRCRRRAQVGTEAEAEGSGGCGSGLGGNVNQVDAKGERTNREAGTGCEEIEGSRGSLPREFERSDFELEREVAQGDGEDANGGRNGETNDTGRGITETGGSNYNLPLHAPGIDDWMAWSAVAALDEARMPSLERGVPVVASGSAPANADLLRIGGNCVDSLEATAAIGCLLDRWFARYSGTEADS